MFREVKSPVMVLFLSWTLSRIYFDLAVPFCSLNLSDDQKREGLYQYHRKAYKHYEIVKDYISEHEFD